MNAEVHNTMQGWYTILALAAVAAIVVGIVLILWHMLLLGAYVGGVGSGIGVGWIVLAEILAVAEWSERE